MLRALMHWLTPIAESEAAHRAEATRAYFRSVLGAGTWRDGAWVSEGRAVLVRYADPAARRCWAREKRGPVHLVYFMDDDLLDEQSLGTLPPRYAAKIKRFATDQKQWLRTHVDEFWVATPALARKYADLKPWVPPLAPTPDLRQGAQASAVRLVYHGSASHAAEHAWLKPILAEVLTQCPQAALEVIGDAQLNRLWRDVPRTRVMHPMRWPQYLDHTKTSTADIGLAPLLPTPFNAGRGPVKFYDYARMGAFVVASDVPPFQGFIEHDQDGLLLPNDPALWVQRLVALVHDSVQRRRLQSAAQGRIAFTEAKPAPTPAKTTSVAQFKVHALARVGGEGGWRWAFDCPSPSTERSPSNTLEIQAWALPPQADANTVEKLELWLKPTGSAQVALKVPFNRDRPDVIQRVLQAQAPGHALLRCGVGVHLPLAGGHWDVGFALAGQCFWVASWELPDSAQQATEPSTTEQPELSTAPPVKPAAAATSKVIVGQEGWLFLDNDTNRSVDQFTGQLKLDAAGLKQWRDYLAQAAALCASGRPRCALVIAPSKEFVLPHLYPHTRGAVTTVDQVLGLPGPRPVTVDGGAVLRAQPDPRLGFMQTDTHWSNRGAMWTVLATLEALGLDAQAAQAHFAQDRYAAHKIAGDLGSKLNPPQIAATDFLCGTDPEKLTVFDNLLPNIGRVQIFESPGALWPQKLLVFGASSSYPMLRYWHRLFARCVFVHSAAHVDPALLDIEQADVLVLQSNGRFLIEPPNFEFDLARQVQTKYAQCPPERRRQVWAQGQREDWRSSVAPYAAMLSALPPPPAAD
ncbi:glycosyltransferase [Roseateles sp. BYS180W]|uniref:Glycosyltransferase n=1 Tax=Roseateles rivi TaxID=3299028 RepID=A0ABW7FZI9_9BURK